MLQIKNISKQYKTGDLVQNALKDVSLNFRDNEFVSILGPSGSGKTTLLNIIGGLDRYDSGDLIINNVSTKNYKDRDWDSYRNHTIGFVFQSYNLIPHQSVLANVELALTISGISKDERRARAIAALEEVGLKEHIHKKPNQMSGGQMQRVAIARALVNNPDILLADEPTGALDTETSVQVMELLKKVADDRLVIMVTHNPELAEEYSTRIVKLKDGVIIDDNAPFNPDEEKLPMPEHKNLGKSFMSLGTALSLSFNNLLTKKGRTILTAFAGSIGIIGIALILSLSNGFQNYIDKIQEDTLTSYPLTITSETADMTSALLSMTTGSGEATEDGKVKEQQYISTMFAQIGSNDLTSFKAYLEKENKKVDAMTSLIRYQYSVSPMVYTTNSEKEIMQLNPSTLLSAFTSGSAMGDMGGTSIFNEMMDDPKALAEQYKVLKGRWPKKYDEVVLILPDENSISDLLLYSLGLRDDRELKDMMSKIMAGEAVESTSEPLTFTYEELMNIPLKLVDASATYKYNGRYGVYEDMKNDASYMKNVYNNSKDLKIVGIMCPKSGNSMSSMGVGYTKELTEYVIDQASKSDIVKKQLANEEVDVFSGKRFDDESNTSGIDFGDMITIDTKMLSSAFGIKISEDDITKMTQGYMGDISAAITADTTKAKESFNNTLSTLAVNMFNNYIAENGTAGVAEIKAADAVKIASDYIASETAQTLLSKLEADYVVPKDTFAGIYNQLLTGMVQGYAATGFPLTEGAIEPFVTQFMMQEPIQQMAAQMAQGMTEAIMQKTILTKVGELTGELMGTVANSFNVDQEAIAGAFKFDLSEEELARLMESMSSGTQEMNANTNLIRLGYQDLNKPTMISIYFEDFEAKELFTDFLKDYNKKMEAEDENKVIKWTDLTGILMSSVKTIVDSVSYVLIAFVSISLVVSSIMIGIITYISVLERTKEIGVLRAIGASKKNISSIFNAETFIVGLLSGIIGIGVTLSLVPPINYVIHTVTNNYDINAALPMAGGIILVVLSVILTLIGGIIPSKKAAKQDPVAALRSE
ncbi:MAG: ABC transporter ATP-binding protein/permease [Firmicutes bacterium]|nr:ABC transporter ATP-binding protein/permease [Bacillota bacterium]